MRPFGIRIADDSDRERLSCAPRHSPEARGGLATGNGRLRLEELQAYATIRGILPDSLVAVISVAWHGSDALTLVYRAPNGRVALSRDRRALG